MHIQNMDAAPRGVGAYGQRREGEPRRLAGRGYEGAVHGDLQRVVRSVEMRRLV